VDLDRCFDYWRRNQHSLREYSHGRDLLGIPLGGMGIIVWLIFIQLLYPENNRRLWSWLGSGFCCIFSIIEWFRELNLKWTTAILETKVTYLLESQGMRIKLSHQHCQD
jgi:hypothetical protein